MSLDLSVEKGLRIAVGTRPQSSAGQDATQLSDIGLVVAIGRGHHDALGEVYRRHGARVHSRARQVVGGGHADEVVQEVFVRLWQKPERFEPGRGTLRSFLLKQAHCRAIDVLRSETARRARDLADLDRRTSTGADVEAAVLARLVGQDLWRLLSSLHEGERDAIALAYFSGHTYRQVAELLGQSEGTIKSRIRKGLARLRVQLAEGGWQDTQRLA
jgi:RNA polymerase sigma-70 factor (ECF subfamily)